MKVKIKAKMRGMNHQFHFLPPSFLVLLAFFVVNERLQIETGGKPAECERPWAGPLPSPSAAGGSSRILEYEDPSLLTRLMLMVDRWEWNPVAPCLH
jgi:hypothetical protein